MPILGKLRDFLDSHGVAYQVGLHPRAYTAQEVAAAQHVPGRELAKVVMVKAGGEDLMAVLPAPCQVHLEALARASGKGTLRLATEKEFSGLFPQCEPGAMPAFGNLWGIPVWVDAGLAQDEEIVCNAGNHEQTVRLKYADYARLVHPRVTSFAVRPETA